MENLVQVSSKFAEFEVKSGISDFHVNFEDLQGCPPSLCPCSNISPPSVEFFFPPRFINFNSSFGIFCRALFLWFSKGILQSGIGFLSLLLPLLPQLSQSCWADADLPHSGFILAPQNQQKSFLETFEDPKSISGEQFQFLA